MSSKRRDAELDSVIESTRPILCNKKRRICRARDSAVAARSHASVWRSLNDSEGTIEKQRPRNGDTRAHTTRSRVDRNRSHATRAVTPFTQRCRSEFERSPSARLALRCLWSCSISCFDSSALSSREATRCIIRDRLDDSFEKAARPTLICDCRLVISFCIFVCSMFDCCCCSKR